MLNDANINIMVTDMSDITEASSKAEAQDALIANLLKRNKDLEQFAYIISHNLRAPLANILGLSSLLHDGGFTTKDSEEVLQALCRSVNNLDQVLTDLNHLVQSDNVVDDNAEVIALEDLVQEIYLSIDRMVVQNNARIICDFDTVPQLQCLKGYLYSIFQNLIVNSIKYRQNEVSPVLTIISRFEGNKVCIYFKDNGRGIDLYKHGHHLFGLYKRFDKSVEGRGMGLYMVKKQVERLGGAISVQSKPNAGTEFRLEFPVSMVKF
jgi:signal transduction histidine kinase